jgi:hypothetical protein
MSQEKIVRGVAVRFLGVIVYQGWDNYYVMLGLTLVGAITVASLLIRYGRTSAGIWLFGALAALICTGVVGFRAYAVNDMASAYDSSQNGGALTEEDLDYLTDVAVELNSQMPLQITPDLTFLSVAHSDGALIYSGVAARRFSGQSDISGLRRALCGQEEVRELIDLGVTMSYILTDVAGETRTASVDRCV